MEPHTFFICLHVLLLFIPGFCKSIVCAVVNGWRGRAWNFFLIFLKSSLHTPSLIFAQKQCRLSPSFFILQVNVFPCNVQVTKQTPVSSRRATSMQSVKSTSGRGRPSASVTQVTSAWTAFLVRVSVSWRWTFASTMASVTSSLDREPFAGGWRLEGFNLLECVCACVCVTVTEFAQNWF